MIVEIASEDGAKAEFVILELQGALEVRAGGTLDGKTLGTLRFEDGKPTIVIGNQKATGKVETLAKPQAVMVREEATGDGGRPTAWTVGGVASPVRMRVVGMVRQRLVFRSRPQPIISAATA